MYVAAIAPDDTYFDWVTPVSGSQLPSVTVAADGAPLVTGFFDGTASFPTGPSAAITLTASGGHDGFVAAMNQDDSYFAWAVAAGGSTGFEFLSPTSITVTADDTPIIAGHFVNTVSFPTGRPAPDDSITLTSTGDEDVFVAAMNRDDSTFAWAVQGASSDEAYGWSVASVDDTVVVTGWFGGTLTFPTGRPAPDDSITLTSTNSNSDVFVAAMNRDDSTFAWAVRAGGTGRDQSRGVAATSLGELFITGYFENTAAFPTGPGTSTSLSTSGSRDVFVAKMNADDSYFAWATKAGGAGSDLGSGITLTSDDTPLITGEFRGSIRFPTGNPAPDDSITLTTNSGTDALFVAALNVDDSNFAWAKGVAGTATSGGLSIAATSQGSPVAAGLSFTGTVEVPTGPSSSQLFTATSSRSLLMTWLGPYVAPPPTPAISGVSPATGSVAGGTSVTITGTDLTGATAVTFGGVAATTITSNTATQIVATTPAGVAGSVDVSVTTANGTATSPNAFTYTAAPTPDPSPPAVVPSAPVNVVGAASVGSATVSWGAPERSGSFAISTYQVVLTPGGASCLVPALATSCTITGLASGETYTAKVRALSGAGWGAYSNVSEPFTPQAPSIVISGTRGEVRGRPGVIVTGSTDLEAGSVLRPWVRFPGQIRYSEGTADILVDDAGTFTWQRRTGKKTYVVVKTPDGDVKSNRVIVPARE